MTTNVAILTNFRTGSTSFTLKKAEEHNLPYKGELFSHEKPYTIGWLKATENNNWNIFDVLRIGKEKACYKIMPSHFDKTVNGKTKIDTFQIQTILEHADKVYYLYRRDFRAQIKSWLAVRRDGSFGHTGFLTNIPIHYGGTEAEYTQRLSQLHSGSYGKTEEPYKATMDPDDPVFHAKTTMSIKSLVKQLNDNYEEMAELYKRVPGELVCYEDYFSGDQYNPYNREIKWTSEPEIDQYVNTYDIEGLFK
jgi:hypothetical protein